MPIQVPPEMYSNLEEIYELGPNCVEVVTASKRTFRITAARTIRGARASYWATYDECVSLDVAGQSLLVWVSRDVEMPWANGNTAEQCLKSALGYVDEIGGKAT